MAKRVCSSFPALSGAGRTTALGILSDMGFVASDSVPVALWSAFVRESKQTI